MMDSKDVYEAQPMLAGEETATRTVRDNNFIERHRYSLWLHILLVSLYTIISVTFVQNHTKKQATSLTPLSDMTIKYRPQPYTDFELSEYAGVPSPKLDKLWHDMLQDITVRVTKDELERSNQTSVELPNGGYMAWLGVSHELHCIKMLRQWNYRSHYHPNISEIEAVHWDIHADHCLEVLRSAALCHADTTLTTFRWDEKEKPMLNTKLIPHKCVDWNVLQDSIRHRVVRQEEVAMMVNPLLHPQEEREQ